MFMENSKSKVDVIIPVFSIKGLRESLSSLGKSDDIVVTLVDDGKNNDFSKIVEEYKDWIEIKIIRNERNVGQGLARQIGVNSTNNEYVFFLDCGDLVYSPMTLRKLKKMFNEHPNSTSTDCVQELWDNEECYQIKLQINGQMYRRSFIDKYEIQFCPDEEASRKMEDVSWSQITKIVNISCHYEIISPDEPTIIKIKDDTSVSQANGREYEYRDFNIGHAKNLIFAFKRALELKNKNLLPLSLTWLETISWEALVSMFCNHQRTLKERPEFTKESLEGAKYYYQNYLINFPVDDKRLKYLFSKGVREYGEIVKVDIDYYLDDFKEFIEKCKEV